jgi:hypothetical protein
MHGQHGTAAHDELPLNEAYQAFHLHGHASIVARARGRHKETPLQAEKKSNQLQLQNLAPLRDAASLKAHRQRGPARRENKVA